jgi:hypothetical protein
VRKGKRKFLAFLKNNKTKGEELWKTEK